MDSTQKEDMDAIAANLADSALRDYELNKYDAAFRSLKQAMSISPQNTAVLRALHMIRQDQSTPTLTRLCQKLVLNNDEQAADEAIRLLTDQSFIIDRLTNSTARDCLALFLLRGDELNPSATGKAGPVISGILKNSKGGREFVAERLSELNGSSGESSVKAFLKKFWDFGQDAVDALVGVLLEPAIWKLKDQREDCAVHAFKYYLEFLKNEEATKTSIAVKVIARVLANESANLHHLVDKSSFNQLISYLHPRYSAEIRSHATLATAKYINNSREVGQSLFRLWLLPRMETEDDLILAFSAAAAMFSLVPGLAAQLLTTEGFIEEVLPVLQSKGPDVEEAALKMLSAACGDQNCRPLIQQACGKYLEMCLNTSAENEVSSEKDVAPTRKALAALIMAKLSYGTGDGLVQGIDKLADILKSIVIKGDEFTQRECIEGLAYSSLQPSVKDSLIRNQHFLQCLLSILKKNNDSTTIYGTLTILLNLTRYPPALSEEQKKLAHLKNYADARPVKKTQVDPPEEDEAVTTRCKAVLDAGAVPILVLLGKKLSLNAVLLASSILFSISKSQRNRGLVSQQGGAKLVLHFYSLMNAKSEAERSVIMEQKTKRLAAHTLARILVSVDPSKVFSSQPPLSSAVRPLVTLLNNEQDEVPRESFDVSAGGILGTFEALLALTNLASTDDPIRELIIRVGWSEIENLLLADNTMIQRAAMELVCNLMACQTMIKKFSDDSSIAKQRLNILLALADADDFATRRAAGGALAMLTDELEACEAIMKREQGINLILQMLEDDNGEIVHRGVVCLSNMVNALKTEQVQEIKAAGAVEKLVKTLGKGVEPEIFDVATPILKQLRP